MFAKQRLGKDMETNENRLTLTNTDLTRNFSTKFGN